MIHDHTVFTPGCFRCELNLDEVGVDTASIDMRSVLQEFREVWAGNYTETPDWTNWACRLEAALEVTLIRAEKAEAQRRRAEDQRHETHEAYTQALQRESERTRDHIRFVGTLRRELPKLIADIVEGGIHESVIKRRLHQLLGE